MTPSNQTPPGTMKDPQTGAMLTLATAATDAALAPVVAGAPFGISAKVAGILGAIAAAVFGVSAFLPTPFGAIASIVAFILAGLAGLSLPSPTWTAGKPVLQGAALSIAAGAVPTISALADGMAPGPWKMGAQALALLAAFLGGMAAPQLGKK